MDVAHKRRWYQFSLRKLFICIALLSLPIAWLGWQQEIVDERHALISEIQRAGGHVLTLDYSSDSKEKLATQTHISWIRRVVMDDRTASVVALPPDKFLSDAEIDRITAVLPEAKIIRLPHEVPAASLQLPP